MYVLFVYKATIGLYCWVALNPPSSLFFSFLGSYKVLIFKSAYVPANIRYLTKTFDI